MFTLTMIVLFVYLCFVGMALMTVLTEVSQDGHAAAIQRWNDSTFYGKIQMPFTYFGLGAVVFLSAVCVPIELLFRKVSGK
jgi:galactitol-specific phosphotransferase system IIC component